MDRHFTIHVHARNEHSVLPRILLAFSRRRLRIRSLELLDPDDARPAQIRLELRCRPEQARDVLAQLRAIVEVAEVRAEQRVQQQPAAARPGQGAHEEPAPEAQARLVAA